MTRIFLKNLNSDVFHKYSVPAFLPIGTTTVDVCSASWCMGTAQRSYICAIVVVSLLNKRNATGLSEIVKSNITFDERNVAVFLPAWNIAVDSCTCKFTGTVHQRDLLSVDISLCLYKVSMVLLWSEL